jgi:hypothetical protein
MGSMVVGFSSSYSSPALESMKDRNITSFEVTSDGVSLKIFFNLLLKKKKERKKSNERMMEKRNRRKTNIDFYSSLLTN